MGPNFETALQNAVKAGVVVAVTKDLVGRGVVAGAIAANAAKILGGGTGRQADVAVGGGPNASGADEALQAVRSEARDALDGVGPSA